MRYIHTQETLDVPDKGTGSSTCMHQLDFCDYQSEHLACTKKQSILPRELLLTSFLVKVLIRSRIVTVEGPRGLNTRFEVGALSEPSQGN